LYFFNKHDERGKANHREFWTILSDFPKNVLLNIWHTFFDLESPPVRTWRYSATALRPACESFLAAGSLTQQWMPRRPE
jgi:hypothetical protein